MSTHFHAVVWIDHHEARIFHFNSAEADRVVVHPADRTVHLHHKANSIGSGHAAEDQAFLQKVTDAIGDAGAVLITGPAGEKTELVKHIELHAPKVRSKVAGIETVDHPSDGMIVDHARRYFKLDHQAPPRSQ